jgi:hypothetical protein
MFAIGSVFPPDLLREGVIVAELVGNLDPILYGVPFGFDFVKAVLLEVNDVRSQLVADSAQFCQQEVTESLVWRASRKANVFGGAETGIEED